MTDTVWQLMVTDYNCNFSSSLSNDLNTLATDIKIKLSVGKSRPLTPYKPSYDAPRRPEVHVVDVRNLMNYSEK